MLSGSLVIIGLSKLLLFACGFYNNTLVENGVAMRVEFTTDGGFAHFPGLSKTIVIDSLELPASDAVELEQLVDAVKFFTLPARIGKAAPGAADYYTYTITITEHGKRHSVQMVDRISDPDLQKLLNFCKEQAKAQRQRAREIRRDGN